MEYKQGCWQKNFHGVGGQRKKDQNNSTIYENPGRPTGPLPPLSTPMNTKDAEINVTYLKHSKN